MYESDLQELTTKCFKLENKLKDTQDLSVKYKQDFDEINEKFTALNGYVNNARTFHIIKDDQNV